MRKLIVVFLILGSVAILTLVVVINTTGRIGPVVFDLERAGLQLIGDPEDFLEPNWSLNNRALVLPYEGYLVGRRGSDYVVLRLEKENAEDSVSYHYWILNAANPAVPEAQGSELLHVRMGDLNNLTSIRLPRSFEFKFYLPNMLGLQDGVEYVYLETFDVLDWSGIVERNGWRAID
ncbi:MAG: hypothetical protein JJU20_04255 [Opitutales bacterium]|nr:hypothetical protein [Opitutales bacterium]